MTTVAIEFRQVSKRFRLFRNRPHSLQEVLLSSPRARDARLEQDLWALRDVSFRIGFGETVGFIGANGAGKSSTLKLIARILEPTSGEIEVTGRVSALLALGAGFHPDLTGRENVFLSGAIMGFPRPLIRQRLDDIVAFSELERFIDVPVRNYSSGMLVRLGFAVATAFQPEILLIDEVLAVGDQSFQARCVQRIAQIQRAGTTIVFVSHDLETTRKLCDRALWLNNGEIRADGETESVIAGYLEYVWRANGGAPNDVVELGKRWGSGEVRIQRVEFLNGDGAPTAAFHTGDTLIARIWYSAEREILHPSFGVAIYRDDGTHVTGPNTAAAGYDIERIAGGGYVDYRVDSLPLTPATYEFSAAVYDHNSIHPYDHRHRQFILRVLPGGAGNREGLVVIPCRWFHQGGD